MVATEFKKYMGSGALATLGNLGAVWFVRQSGSYEIGVAAGAIIGTLISFLFTKYFVFSSATKYFSVSELARFLTVHSLGVLLLWIVSVAMARFALPALNISTWVEPVSSLIGIGSMVLFSYLGHRHFTYGVGSR